MPFRWSLCSPGDGEYHEVCFVAFVRLSDCFWVLVGIAVLTAALGGCSWCAPGKEAKLTEASRKDPACEKEIQGALQALRKYLGIGTGMTKADVDSVLTHDSVVKSYARDGVRYTMTISFRMTR